ncbi:hypothetical protein C356_01767 [Cryptococcus neoformans c45]|nr:hypothetical protein C356_01767 [Cryptococcus neoformans var. grubii c45]
MLPYTSGCSTPVSSSSSLHFHASLPSHLSTELAFLQTFIKRASSQHRSQLFLQRMEGVLRVGKAMMLHVRKLPEERSGEACIAWRWKGENLIKKMIKMLFSAQYIASQIIDLYHFLPLQTTVLSIYARLFTVTVSLANSLEMDVEELLIAAKRKTNGKRKTAAEENQKVHGVAMDTLLVGAIQNIGVDLEMGEVIERSSESLGRGVSKPTPRSISERSAFSPKPLNPGELVSSAVAALSSTADLGNEYLEKEITVVSKSVELPPSLQIDELLGTSTNIAKDKKKKRRVEADTNVSDAKTPEEISIEGDIIPKKKKRVVKDEKGKGDEKAKAKKKKKKDAMDDIFGF